MAEYWVIQGRTEWILQKSSYRTPGHLCTRLDGMREEKAAKEMEQKEAACAIQQIEAPGKCVMREEAYNAVQVSSNFKRWKSISDKMVSSSKGSRVSEKLDSAKPKDATALGPVVSGSSNLRREWSKGAVSSLAINKRRGKMRSRRPYQRRKKRHLKRGEEAAEKRVEEREKLLLGLYSGTCK